MGVANSEAQSARGTAPSQVARSHKVQTPKAETIYRRAGDNQRRVDKLRHQIQSHMAHNERVTADVRAMFKAWMSTLKETNTELLRLAEELELPADHSMLVTAKKAEGNLLAGYVKMSMKLMSRQVKLLRLKSLLKEIAEEVARREVSEDTDASARGQLDRTFVQLGDLLAKLTVD